MDYERLYDYRFRRVDQGAREEVWKAITEHLYEELGRPSRVLDPAAGRGEFINSVPADERWAVDEVEYESSTFRDGVRFVQSDIFKADLPASHFDGILVSNFLEHLGTQEETADFLSRMYRVTAPGGRIAVMGPNFRYCHDLYFDYADHTLVYTHLAIAEHLYTAGFEPVKVVPRYLPYSFTGRLPASRGLTSMYLRMPLAWRFFGKQFLVVGERPVGDSA
jgi:ubiquinone/menaquinone biosynthesis C-methylase UbiE